MKINLITTALSFTFVFFFCLSFIAASDGDDGPEFQACVSECVTNQHCRLDWVLRFSGWDCGADCKYRCMRSDLEKMRGKGGKFRVLQYYGKWPFVRLFGAQELFSVLFSLGNFFACIYGYLRYFCPQAKRFPRHWMNRVHFASFLITANTWLQSALFHYRDTPLTEKLDYFSACACIVSTVPVVLIRTRKIRTIRAQLTLVAPFLAVFVLHCAYMSFVVFDYGYHVKFNAVFGILANVLWLHFAVSLGSASPIKRLLSCFVGLNVASMAMVAVDFPPFFDLIDMHALWHLSTIPITLMWYKLIAIDTNSLAIHSKLKAK
jgi:post-GPI attachment to proteins factor 3